MDRVAQLAACADRALADEGNLDWVTDRAQTRAILWHAALALGFTDKEISAAIDTALAGR